MTVHRSVIIEAADAWSDETLDARHVAAVLSMGGFPRAFPGLGWVGPTGCRWRIGAPPPPLHSPTQARGPGRTRAYMTRANLRVLRLLEDGPRTTPQLAAQAGLRRSAAGFSLCQCEAKGWTSRERPRRFPKDGVGAADTWTLTEDGRGAIAKALADGVAGRFKGELRRDVLTALRDGPLAAKALARALNAGWGGVRKTLARLAELELVETTGGGESRRLWSLTEAGKAYKG